MSMDPRHPAVERLSGALAGLQEEGRLQDPAVREQAASCSRSRSEAGELAQQARQCADQAQGELMTAMGDQGHVTGAILRAGARQAADLEADLEQRWKPAWDAARQAAFAGREAFEVSGAARGAALPLYAAGDTLQASLAAASGALHAAVLAERERLRLARQLRARAGRANARGVACASGGHALARQVDEAVKDAQARMGTILQGLRELGRAPGGQP